MIRAISLLQDHDSVRDALYKCVEQYFDSLHNVLEIHKFLDQWISTSKDEIL